MSPQWRWSCRNWDLIGFLTDNGLGRLRPFPVRYRAKGVAAETADAVDSAHQFRLEAA